MLARIITCAVSGVDGLPVLVEVDLAQGLPSFSTVGLAEGAVREAKDRVRAAIKNSGYAFPQHRITVNLAPASVKKEGAGYDLPIALGILAASGVLRSALLAKTAVTGELSLDGVVRPVNGVLSMALAARQEGLKFFLVPAANAAEAAIVQGLQVYPLEKLQQAVDFLSGRCTLTPLVLDPAQLFAQRQQHSVDFADVRGQEHVRRALEVAAAGGHNLLLCGSPGAGKTMMARRLPTILPDLVLEEAIETTKIFSIAGLLPEKTALMVTRPFRSPHHTVSDAGLIGGGHTPRPGEVSLAHNGVLFLDELPEFKKHVLEVLRQPLEDGVVTIARASASLKFPAQFMLVAAMNPCPCGYFGDTTRECSCSPHQVQRYRSRLSGPLLDRIDMHLEVPALQIKELTSGQAGESSATIRARVNQARKQQQRRFHHLEGIYCNAQMQSQDIKKYCHIEAGAEQLLNASISRLRLSARAYHRILKIARTIADLADCEVIQTAQVAEAVQYRRVQYEL